MHALRSIAVTAPLAALATAGVALSHNDRGEAAKNPAAILADAARDVAKVKNYHFAGSQIDEVKSVKMNGDVFANGSGRVTLSFGKAKAQLVDVPGGSYIKANAAFWARSGRKTSTKVIRRLADRWIRLPPSEDASTFGNLTPKRVAACLIRGNGTMTKLSPVTFGRQPAIVLQDAGDRPGTTPSRYYFTSTPPILLLRAVQTGRTKPGGAKDRRCQDGEDDNPSTGGSLTFSRFDQAQRVTAPRGAVTLDQLVAEAPARSS